MLNSIKKMVQKDTNDKTIATKESKLKGTFGGLSGEQIKKQIELSISGQQNSSLHKSKMVVKLQINEQKIKLLFQNLVYFV